MKIVITDYPQTLDRNIEKEVQILKKMLPEAEIVVYQYTGNKEELIQIIKDADAVKTAFIFFDKELLDASKALKCISFGSTGYNNVDFEYAKQLNVKIMAVPEYCTEEVADHAMLLLLALNKNLKEYIYSVEKMEKWSYRLESKSHELKKQILGVIGFGKIAKAVVKRASAFGIQSIVYSSHLTREEELEFHVKSVTMEELQKESDIISIHSSLDRRNYHMLNEAFFEKLEKSPIIINVSRGGLIDEQALVKALDHGYIRAAGLDVLESEDPDLGNNPLSKRKNVILTPHTAFYSEESIERLHETSTVNIGYFLKGELDKVNSIIE